MSARNLQRIFVAIKFLLALGVFLLVLKFCAQPGPVK